jgi:hypothetical protein
MTDPTDAEHDLLCHLHKILYDDIPNCGCNEPDAAFKLIHDIVLLAPLHSGTWVQARELIGSDGAFQIVLSAMTDAKLLEHGGSMGGSWLGSRGRWFLWAVEQAGGIDGLDDKLQSVGFPHERDEELKDMQPCTDACWTVPDGSEPAPKLVPKLIDPVVFVACPGPSCVSYQYGADHQHTARQT